MKTVLTFLLRILAIGVPTALGVVAILYAGALRGAPEVKERNRPPQPMRVITLAPTPIVPRVSGYGTVAPAREWRAVARVEGEVVETSPLLANGEIAPAGTILLKIDDTDLRLTLAQIDAQMDALDVKDETLGASLEINRSDLALGEADLERQKTLQQRGVATQVGVDQAERAVLAARAKVTESENQLALNEAERNVLAAQRAIAARNLDFTEITAPYDLRIGTVSAELGQVVTRGATLVTAEGTDAAEITAQFPLGRMGPLVRALGPDGTVMGLKAEVRLTTPGHNVNWDATVDRVAEAVDARVQAANIVVRVDDPLGKAQPGVRPPLRRNMFVEVQLSAPARKALVVPADAVQNGRALVVTAEGKLEPRSVALSYSTDSVAVVSKGLEPGDKLVVTDPSVAVPGMMVKPVEDEALTAEIAAAATGAASGADKGTEKGSGKGAGKGEGKGSGKGPGKGKAE